MAEKGEAFVLAFEKAVPRTWDVKTGRANGAAAAWAKDPGNDWQLEIINNPNTGFHSFNVELHKMDARGQGVAGLVNGDTVNSPREVKSTVRQFSQEAVGKSRTRKGRKQRTGEVHDDAGMFDDLF